MSRRAVISLGAVLLSAACSSSAPASPSAATTAQCGAGLSLSWNYFVHSTDLQARSPQRRVGAVLWLARPLDAALVGRIERAGAQVARRGGRPVALGRAVAVRMAPADALRVACVDGVERVLPPWPPGLVAPQDVLPDDLSAALVQTGLRPVWLQRDAQGLRLTGQGQRIADFDYGIDVLDPLLFRADGGYYDWLDVDGDGVLTPGVDAVDLDGNGAPGEGEILRLTGGQVYSVNYGTVLAEAPSQDPGGLAWYYADSNGSGAREAGRFDGFDESTPAYGEPLFALDDVDGNGRADPGERLVRLGTSKIRAVWTAPGTIHRRGVDLIDTPAAYYASHGTAVAALLAGGLVGTTRVVGGAPDAELVLVDVASIYTTSATSPMEPSPATFLEAATWAAEEGTSVFLHEYGTLIGYFGDGTGPWEQVLDQFSEQGIVQVVPTHNFAGDDAHAQLMLAPGQTLDLPLTVEPVAGWPTRLTFSVRWRGTPVDGVQIEFVLADGAAVDADAAGSVGGASAWHARDVSPGGTALAVYDLKGLPSGSNDAPYFLTALRFTLAPMASATLVDVAAADDTGYGTMIRFEDFVTDDTTIAFPATAESAIAVGAYGLNVAEPGALPGNLRSFSGRGPRIDGAMGVDITAPDDHFTSAFGPTYGEGNYVPLGGTSGAGPLVAAAVALYLQAWPDSSPMVVDSALQASARRDEVTGYVANPAWGWGRLDALGAIAPGISPPSAPPPHAEGRALPGNAQVGDAVELDAGASQPGAAGMGPLAYRWDFDYDGAWDEERTGDPIASAVFDAPGVHWVKLEVEQVDGQWAQALVRVEVAPGPTTGPGPSDAGAALPGLDAAGTGDAPGGRAADASGDALAREGDTSRDAQAPTPSSGSPSGLPGEDAGGIPELAPAPGGGGGCSGGPAGLPPWSVGGVVVAMLAAGFRRRRRFAVVPRVPCPGRDHGPSD